MGFWVGLVRPEIMAAAPACGVDYGLGSSAVWMHMRRAGAALLSSSVRRNGELLPAPVAPAAA